MNFNQTLFNAETTLKAILFLHSINHSQLQICDLENKKLGINPNLHPYFLPSLLHHFEHVVGLCPPHLPHHDPLPRHHH